MKISRRSLAAGLALMAAPAVAHAGPRRLAAGPDIDAAVARALAKLPEVPGLGVAVYSRDGTHARGHGWADVEQGVTADADTAYYIASATKSFTAMAMAKLAQRGAIDLNGTVAALAPDAPFAAAVQADKARIRDLLTHTSGMENDPIGFRVAYSGDHNAPTLWRLLAQTRPNAEAPLGKHQYTNVGYNILTVLTDRKLGVRWQDLLQRELFDPAGFSRTSAYMSRAQRRGWSVARGYATALPEGRRRVELAKVDVTMQSAGGLIMSPKDAVRWLELLNTDGKVGGRQVVPAAAVRMTRDMLVETGETREPYAATQYALGWNIGRRGTDAIYYHFGGFAGFRSHISYIPARGLGVAVFANDGPVGAGLADLVAEYVYARLTARLDADAVFDAAVANLDKKRGERVLRVTADRATRAARPWTLSRPRADYAGKYASAAMGEMVVAERGGELSLSIGQLKSKAEANTGPESIRVELVPDSGSVISFELGADGAPAALTWDGERYALVS